MTAIPTTILLVHRFLADYARNPVNLLVLVLVPLGVGDRGRRFAG
jgi:hypothetical protein